MFTIQLVQINNYYQERLYLPYSVGLLHAYCQSYAADPARYHFRPFLYERQPLNQAVAQALGADVVAFSVYVWSEQYSLKMAQQIKALRPETLIVFGGPHVPDFAESWLRAHPWVDIAAHGEGDALFLEILEALPGQDWAHIQGISYVRQGRFHYQPPRPRRKDLDALPSPFLNGSFDELLRQRPGPQWVTSWESNRGCPFRCSYCDWGSAVATKVSQFGLERVKQEIDWISDNGIFMVFCADANFGMLKRDIEITEYLVSRYGETGYPKLFLPQSAKNVTERTYQVHTLLSQAHLISMATLSLQSLNPQALKDSQRENISLQTYRDLQTRFRHDKVRTYTDLLIGLPGETLESFIDGIGQVIEEGQHEDIRFYNVYLLPNSEMAQPHYRKRYQLKTIVVPYAEPSQPVEAEVYELQEMVIGTYSMTSSEWGQARVVAYWVRLLFMRKLLHLPMVLLREIAGISYAEFFRWFLKGQWPATQVMAAIRDNFVAQVEQMEQGAPELVPLQFWDEAQGKEIQLWSNVDVFIQTGLLRTNSWHVFYGDAELVLQALLQKHGKVLPHNVLRESLQVASKLAHPRHFAAALDRPVQSNFWQVYQAHLHGESLPLVACSGRLVREAGDPSHSLRFEHLAPVSE